MAGYLDIKKKYNEQLEKIKAIPDYGKKLSYIFGKVIELSCRSKSNKFYNEEVSAYYVDWNIANPRFNNLHQRVLDIFETEEVEDYIFTVSKQLMSGEDWESPAAILFLKDEVRVITCQISEEDANSVLGYFKEAKLCECSLSYKEVRDFMTNVKTYKKHIIMWPIKFNGTEITHNVFVHASFIYVQNIIDKKVGVTNPEEVKAAKKEGQPTKAVQEYVTRRRYCFICGTAIEKGAKFCAKCGRKVK